MIRAEAAREEARRPTSNTPSNLTQESLSVVVKQVCLLLGKPEGYVQSVIDTFGRIGIRSCHALFCALENTRCECILSAAFTRRFEASSCGLVLCHKQLSFFRCASMYMNGRWEYDHEYFQRMIEWEQRSNTEAVGAIITVQSLPTYMSYSMTTLPAMIDSMTTLPVMIGLCRVYRREEERTLYLVMGQKYHI